MSHKIFSLSGAGMWGPYRLTLPSQWIPPLPMHTQAFLLLRAMEETPQTQVLSGLVCRANIYGISFFSTEETSS